MIFLLDICSLSPLCKKSRREPNKLSYDLQKLPLVLPREKRRRARDCIIVRKAKKKLFQHNYLVFVKRRIALQTRKQLKSIRRKMDFRLTSLPKNILAESSVQRSTQQISLTFVREDILFYITDLRQRLKTFLFYLHILKS